MVTLKAAGATGDLPGGNDLENEALELTQGDAEAVTTITGAMDSKAFEDVITQAITDTNNDETVCPMNASKIQKFTILPTDFSVSTDELTPTFKLKRSVVHAKYQTAIDAMYASKSTYVKFQDT